MAFETARQEAKREQIRSAAAALFLGHGFAETSMDAVTEAAGVSKQTLYRYYENKAALFADVLGQLIAEPAGQAAEHVDGTAPRTESQLEALLVSGSERYLARVLEPKQISLLRVVIAEGSRFPELTEAFRSTLPAAGAFIISALEAGRATGLIADWVDARTAARAFAGLQMMFILRDGLLTTEPRRPERQQLVEMVRLFVHGIRARRKDPGG
ncbi:MAG TPA: TetR/AcrR family transcriptional regulator [Candidatus Eisenbacteria bacterium]|nr:TetR/AcrR family transcriptional regulator [Candidatus Eisenbacteria bacterium]